MSQQSLRAVRVIDPILSTVVQGYAHPEHVGMALFPRVPVPVSGGQVIEFGKEAFRLYNGRRAPGAATKRVQFGYLGRAYALKSESLEGQVPREHLRDASKVPGINLGTRAVNLVMGALSLSLEKAQADIALNASNYDSDHKINLTSAKWSNDANNPCKDIRTGQEAIRASTGIRPNTLVLSATAFAAMRENAKVLERLKYTTKDSITPQMLAALLDLKKVVVGDAVYAGSDDEFTDVWGNHAVLAYVPTAPSNMEEPSYGYTYTMEGHPLVEEAYYDNNTKSWIYPVSYERDPVLTGITSGYLLQNVV